MELLRSIELFLASSEVIVFTSIIVGFGGLTAWILRKSLPYDTYVDNVILSPMDSYHQTTAKNRKYGK